MSEPEQGAGGVESPAGARERTPQPEPEKPGDVADDDGLADDGVPPGDDQPGQDHPAGEPTPGG